MSSLQHFLDVSNAAAWRFSLPLSTAAYAQRFARFLELSLSLFISRRGNAAEINQFYLQARDTVRRRICAGSGCLLYYEENTLLSKDCIYPEKKERALTEALLKGNFEQSQALYLQIINECVNTASKYFELAVSRLMLSLNQLTVSLEKKQDSPPVPALVIDLESVESIDEIHHQFLGFMRQIAEQSVKRRKGRVDFLVESVNNVISIQYADPDLCNERIANTMGLSASYLGRLYKQGAGISITEKIQEVRMEHARKLLEETDAPVRTLRRL